MRRSTSATTRCSCCRGRRRGSNFSATSSIASRRSNASNPWQSSGSGDASWTQTSSSAVITWVRSRGTGDLGETRRAAAFRTDPGHHRRRRGLPVIAIKGRTSVHLGLRGMRPIPLAVILVASCTVDSPHDRAFVAMELSGRAGMTIRPPGEVAVLPPAVVLEDGLTESEAVAIALWNNPAFAAVLVDLDVSRAELEMAGVFRNPELSVLLPWGPKQIEATLALPLDALLHRPARVAAAKLDVERVAARLVRDGLGLIRDTQVSFAAAVLANDRAELARQKALVLERRSELVKLRTAVGDSSEAQATAALVDAGRVRNDAAVARNESMQARQQLRAILGLPADMDTPVLVPGLPDANLPPIATLLPIAMGSRPDLRAAEVGLAAAGERVGLTRAEIWQIALLADMDGVTGDPDEIGPGFAVELPLFDQRQAALARAGAEVQRAALRFAAVRFTIVQEVQQAFQLESAARDELAGLDGSLVPASEREVAETTRLVASGDESEDVVLRARLRRLE